MTRPTNTLFSSCVSKYRNQSIAQKLVIWVLILGTSVMLVGASVRILIFHYESKKVLEKQADIIGFFLEKPLQQAIINRDKNYVTTVVKDIANYPFVVNVTLSYEQNDSYITINESSKRHRNMNTPTLDFRYNLDAGDSTAYLALILEHQFVDEETTTKLAYNMLIEGFIILSIVIGVLTCIRKLVTRHLEKISDFAMNMSLERLSESLALDRKKSEEDGQDELDHVVYALEHMRQQLIEDIDDRRSMELAFNAEVREKNETKRLAEEAKASNQAKSQFIATMSHEIRTPMNGVVGMVEMMRDTPLNDDQKQYLDVIYRSAESLMGIIDDILDYSKIEAGKMVLDQTEFDLKELMRDCVKLFGATAQKRKLDLLTNIAPETPTRLVGDPARMRQILLNLLGNAFKFTTQGHVLVQAKLVNTENKQHTLHFSISDSGIGIDESVHETLFDAFRQAESGTKRRFGGTGLGLAICKQLVELMGGHIGLTSEPGKGSHFWFTCVFPSADGNDQSKSDLGSMRRVLSGKNVLCVHESFCIEAPLKAHCDYFDMDLNYGDSGLQALELIHSASKRFDFILLNDTIGKIPGAEIAIAIRKLDGYKKTPIFLLSNDSNFLTNSQEESIVTRVIPKPLNIDQVLDSMVSSVENRKNPSRAEESPSEINNRERLNVLVAEDNAINRMVIEGLLKKFDAEPSFCENGLEIIEAYEKRKIDYDVIFMDCEMPEMDGFEATQKIRETEKQNGHKRTPIIALTAHVESDHRKRVFDVGMDYYLSKPVTQEKLSEALLSMQLIQ